MTMMTWHLCNHPTHKLTHGAAYNYDTVVIGVMVAVNSLLGLPWLVAATVRSLNQIHALATKSPQGKIVSVQETRLTHLGIHLLCLASIFALDVLKLIPVPVLYVSAQFDCLLSWVVVPFNSVALPVSHHAVSFCLVLRSRESFCSWVWCH